MRRYRVILKTYSQGELWVDADSEAEAKAKARKIYDIDPESSDIYWNDGSCESGIVAIEANYDVYDKNSVLAFLREISDICKEIDECPECPYYTTGEGCVISRETNIGQMPEEWFDE